MAQRTIVRDTSVHPPNLRTWILVVASAVADLLAITGFLASLLKQDSLLILSVTVVGLVIAGAIYQFHEKINRLARVRVLGVYCAVSLVLVILAWAMLANTAVTPVKVDIIDPQDGGKVSLRFPVKGTLSDRDATVYVVVHPLKVSEMWVQPLPVVDGDGNWQAEATFGTDIFGIEERYEVIALATNDNFLVSWATGNSLKEGQKLTSLPHKTNKSSLITVTRPK